jgi:hypothetical protein
VTASCTKGTFTDSVANNYYGLIDKGYNAKDLYWDFITTCNSESNFQAALNGCYGKSTCQVTYNDNWFVSSCIATRTSSHKAYLHMYCEKVEIVLPFLDNTTYSKWICSGLVCLNGLVILLLYIRWIFKQKN